MDSFTKIKTIILDIETHFDTSELRFKGLNFWPIVRKQIQGDISYKRETEYYNHIEEKESPLNSLFNFFKFTFYKFILFAKKDKYRIESEIVFNGYPSVLYKIKVQDKYYNQYIDPYYELLKESYRSDKIIFKGEQDLFNGIFYCPCHVIKDSLLMKYAFLKKKIFKTTLVDEFSTIRSLVEDINNYSLKNYNYLPINKETFSHIDSVITNKLIFDVLFKNSKITIFFMEDGYDNQNFGAIMACKENNIKTIEIQHGIIEDAVYSPYTKQVSYEILPDYIWTWNKRDSDYIHANNSIHSTFLKPLTLGNLWISKCIDEQFSEESKVFFKAVRQRFRKIITVTLQPTFALSHELISFMKDSQGIYFIIKPHPNSTTSEIIDLKNIFKGYTNIDFEISSKLKLIQLFKLSDFHITHSSASAIEALSVGVKTIIYDSYGELIFKDYINDGAMFLCIKSIEMYSAINDTEALNTETFERYSVLPDKNKIIMVIKTILQ